MHRHRHAQHKLSIGRKQLLTVVAVCLLAAGCGSSTDSAATATPEAQTESETTTETATETATETTVAAGDAESCDDVAAAFVVKGSANPDLDDPEVNATCVDGMVVVTSNGIPDFPYIETTPGSPTASAIEYTLPGTPTVADTPTAVPALGAIAVAVNGIPIFGAAEGPGGDVLSMPSFTECGGHNGPSGYHYHTFTITGSDTCLFTEEEAMSDPVLFGYAFDGYPIYVGNYSLGYTSSYELTDPSLFATSTFDAHTYVEGYGDLDECNGLTDENGNYAYYTTDSYPYTVGCYHGVVAESATGADEGDRPPRPEPGEDGEDGEADRPPRPEPGEDGEGGDRPAPPEAEDE